MTLLNFIAARSVFIRWSLCACIVSLCLYCSHFQSYNTHSTNSLLITFFATYNQHSLLNTVYDAYSSSSAELLARLTGFRFFFAFMTSWELVATGRGIARLVVDFIAANIEHSCSVQLSSPYMEISLLLPDLYLCEICIDYTYISESSNIHLTSIIHTSDSLQDIIVLGSNLRLFAESLLEQYIYMPSLPPRKIYYQPPWNDILKPEIWNHQ